MGDIENGEVDLVVIYKISRLSRLGAGEIHEFIQHCLDNETSGQDLEVGLSLELDDDIVDRAVSRMLAGIMGELARIEHTSRNSGESTPVSKRRRTPASGLDGRRAGSPSAMTSASMSTPRSS